MALNRSTIIRGPCQIEWPAGTGNYYYSQGDVKVDVGFETFDIINSAFGKVQERVTQRVAKVSFTPVGNVVQTTPSVNTGDAAPVGGTGPDLWHPYGLLYAGDRLLGTAVDQNLVIWSYFGTKATVYNVGMTKIPEFIASATKTFAGTVEFTGLGKGFGGSNNTITPPTTVNAFVQITTGAGAPTNVFNPNNIFTETYAAALGSLSSPWNDINTTQGWSFSYNLNLAPVMVDGYGIVDWTVGNVTATGKAQVVGVDENAMIGASGAGLLNMDVGQGSAVVSNNNLVLTGANSGLTVTLFNTIVKLAPIQYGLTTLRLADVEFIGQRAVVSNAISQVFDVSG
jgi:hypothetical protein